jgi:hypothetical protein
VHVDLADALDRLELAGVAEPDPDHRHLGPLAVELGQGLVDGVRAHDAQLLPREVVTEHFDADRVVIDDEYGSARVGHVQVGVPRGRD